MTTEAHISLTLKTGTNSLPTPEVRRTVWVLTDGKAGDEQPCLGVAEALGYATEVKRISPRAPWSWAMPRGPVDPRDAPTKPESPIAPPFPDCVIASGRRAVPYLRSIRKASGGKTFTVFLKDPRTGAGTADIIWVPAHDRLRGDNVIVTITPPHRLSPSRLAAARMIPDPRLIGAHPHVGVLVGGNSRHHRFDAQDIIRFSTHLEQLARSGAHLMITTSRRTPDELVTELRKLGTRHPSTFLWDGSGENPYTAMLALADSIVVTADSYNMIGEATATGVPVLVFEPTGGHPKLTAFIKSLTQYGAVHPLTGHLEGAPYKPLDATQIVANRIMQEMARREGEPHADPI